MMWPFLSQMTKNSLEYELVLLRFHGVTIFVLNDWKYIGIWGCSIEFHCATILVPNDWKFIGIWTFSMVRPFLSQMTENLLEHEVVVLSFIGRPFWSQMPENWLKYEQVVWCDHFHPKRLKIYWNLYPLAIFITSRFQPVFGQPKITE